MHCMSPVAVTISFNQSAYNVSESVGSAHPVLVLSYPLSINITVQVSATNQSATGKYICCEL